MNRYGFKRANVNVAREKGAVSQVRINTVTIERKTFSKVYGVFRALYSSSCPFSIIFMFLTRRYVQQMENANRWGVLLKRRLSC